MLENERFDLIQKTGFGIIQNKQWFSYGIDAVLVSHFSQIKKGATVMDLGTGTAIIPLLVSLNHDVSKIYAIEKQKEVADMAIRSISRNHLEEVIEVINTDILSVSTHCRKGTMDVVISNPPYFKKGNALINTVSIKAQSRHETTGDLKDFIRVASEMLKEKGCFYMVHRPMRLVDIMYYCRTFNLEPKEIQFVYPHENKPPNILLIKCVKNGNQELKYLDNLYVYDKDRNYTDSIKAIYSALNIDVF
jgi:tRNA1Val (adenine37-N6)-methyltransferase